MILVLLVGLDFTISLPAMEASCLPFNWMTLVPDSAASLYPIIQNLTFDHGTAHIATFSSKGTVILQRSTNLQSVASWMDVATMTSTGQVVSLVDTNPVGHAIYYRIKHILVSTP